MHHAEKEMEADRLLEILAYRACQAWLQTMGVNSPPEEISFSLTTSAQSTRLLSGRMRITIVEPVIVRNFEQLSDNLLFGGRTKAHLVRKALRRRLGRPHSTNSWPCLALQEGPRAVLDTLMTHAHKTRRQASMLEKSAPPCAEASPARRL